MTYVHVEENGVRMSPNLLITLTQMWALELNIGTSLITHGIIISRVSHAGYFLPRLLMFDAIEILNVMSHVDLT